MISNFKINNRQLVLQDKKDADTVWTHIEKPSEEQIQQLSREYQLPKDYLTAILDDSENSREEGLEQAVFHKAILILLQFPHEVVDENGYIQFKTYPLSLIITTDQKILTVSNRPPLFFDFIHEQSLPVNDMSIEINLFLQVLWRLVISYNDCLKKMKRHLESLEKQIQVSTENKQLYQLMNIQKSLVLFESASQGNYDTLMTLSKTSVFTKSHAYQNNLHDVLVEVRQARASIHIQLQLTQHMTDIFSAVVSNNLNNVMKILTSLTIVLTIPTIIGGIFGMNVSLPFSKNESAFFFISVITLLLCWIAIRYLKKKNLL